MSWCECPICENVFTGIRAFDVHQRVNYEAKHPVTCIPPYELGMVRNKHGRWMIPADPDKPNPWAAKRS
jgi:hypothetical protein